MIPREIQVLLGKLEPIYGSRIQALRVEYQMNPASRAEIELLLSKLATRELGDQGAPAPPPRGSMCGRYPLGDIMLGSRKWDSFGLNEDEWIQHVGVFGRSGSGKTNAGFLMLKQLAAAGKPFLVFDWKRNYRDLLQLREFTPLKVLTVGRDIAPFRFNPLIPPDDTEPEIFLKKLIEIMMQVYWLGEGVAYLLQMAIDEVYRQRGVYAGTCQQFPTVFDVRDWLRAYKAKGREAQWMDSTRRVIETLCFGQLGKVLSAPSNAAFQQSLAERVVLELDALANSDKTFLIETVLLWLHQMRMAEPDRERFKHAIVIEEAHHVLLKRNESKETVMDVIMREIRELGEAIVFLDQHPSLISIPSLGNSYCTIAMNLKHGSDTSALTRAMLLSEEERECLGQLQVGEALVKLQGRWVKPFLVRFPHLKVEKGRVRDADLARRYITDSSSGTAIPRNDRRGEEIPVSPSPDRESKGAGITGAETRLLEEVMAYPTAGITQRRERLGLSVRKLYAVVSLLADKGLLCSSSVSTPKGKTRVLRLTAAGAEGLGLKKQPIDGARHESDAHWYWKTKLAEELRERRYTVAIEKEGADLVLEKDGERIAIEIETGKSDAEANVRRNLANGFDRVIGVWLNGRPSKTSPDERVRVMTLAGFRRLFSLA